MRIVFALSATLLMLVIGKVVLLQTADRSSLLAAGRAQSTWKSRLVAQRGTIVDLDGNELAVTVPSVSVIADPKLIEQPEAAVAALDSVLHLDAAKRDSLVTSFTVKDKSFVYVARQLPVDTAAKINALDVVGVDVISEPHRVEPGSLVAPSLVGTTGIDGDGLSGLELQYDRLLRGVNGTRVLQHDKNGHTVVGGDMTVEPAIAGSDLLLTIDSSLQYEVEMLLMQRVEDLHAKGGTVMIVDTASGDIRAWANVDRDKSGQVRISPGNNGAVEAHEPGSVAKVFSIVAALDQGAVTSDSTFQVPGSYTFDKGTKWQRTIRDAEAHAVETMSVRKIVTESSNIGTMLVARTVGKQVVHHYHELFGFGARSALNFPGESRGYLKPAEKLRSSEAATVAYGYGFGTTSLQLVMGVNAIANRGVYVAPSLLRAVVDPSGKTSYNEHPGTHRVVSATAASEMGSLLTNVVCSGTGKPAAIKGMSVAGKTGTALKYQGAALGYGTPGKQKYYSSFVGYLPAKNPQVTILVSIDEPQAVAGSVEHVGGRAAGPLFAQVGQAAIRELHVEPVAGDTGCKKGS